MAEKAILVNLKTAEVTVILIPKFIEWAKLPVAYNGISSKLFYADSVLLHHVNLHFCVDRLIKLY